MWSFWTAFEHGFDENELKCAQTRTILTKLARNRPPLTTLNRVFPEDFAFLTPPATPPFLINVESALEIPLFLTF